jgi:hypothetical protein
MTYETIDIIGENRLVSATITYNTIGDFGMLNPQTKTVYNLVDIHNKILIPNWFDIYQVLPNNALIIGYERAKEEFQGLKKFSSYRIVQHIEKKYQYRYGAINPKGELILEPIVDFLEDGNEDTLIATYQERRGYFSSLDGTQITPIYFHEAYKYHDGLARVKFINKYGYIDKRIMRNPSNRLQYQIPADFVDATDFSNQEATVSNGHDSFLIDPLGNRELIKNLSLRRNEYHGFK